jgi:hypothetical protein
VTPKVTTIRQDDTHRLIPFRYPDSSALARLAENEAELDELLELDSSTDDRVLGEAGVLPGISVHELLFGVSYAHIVNAAFTHAHPGGSRFNGPGRGAWYAGFELETAQEEIAFHKSQELIEIKWREPETFKFDDYLADSQELAGELVAGGSAGIVYPSVRRQKGTCIACFRPALVNNVRKGWALTLTFKDAQSPPIFR